MNPKSKLAWIRVKLTHSKWGEGGASSTKLTGNKLLFDINQDHIKILLITIYNYKSIKIQSIYISTWYLCRRIEKLYVFDVTTSVQFVSLIFHIKKVQNFSYFFFICCCFVFFLEHFILIMICFLFFFYRWIYSRNKCYLSVKKKKKKNTWNV